MNSERNPLDPSATASCPTPETLVAYLANVVDRVERDRIDAHLDGCDHCLDLTLAGHARLRLGTIGEPVPAKLLQPTAAVAPPNAAGPAGVPPQGPRRPTPVVRRLPVPPIRWLVAPLALAAGVALMLISPDFNSRRAEAPQMRGVPGISSVKITAHQADVRSDPSLHATVVAQLSRGAVVEVAGQEREWYRVQLPGGGQGWIEQRACR